MCLQLISQVYTLQFHDVMFPLLFTLPSPPEMVLSLMPINSTPNPELFMTWPSIYTIPLTFCMSSREPLLRPAPQAEI